MTNTPGTDDDTRRRLSAYETVLHDLERHMTRKHEDPELDRLAHRAHNVLCHLDDGCGH